MGEMVYMVSYTWFQGEKGCRALGLARNLRFNLKYYIQISKIQKGWHGQTVTMLWWLLAPLRMWNSGDLIFVVKWVKLVSQNEWGGLCLESWRGFSRSGKLYKQLTKDIRSVVCNRLISRLLKRITDCGRCGGTSGRVYISTSICLIDILITHTIYLYFLFSRKTESFYGGVTSIFPTAGNHTMQHVLSVQQSIYAWWHPFSYYSYHETL